MKELHLKRFLTANGASLGLLTGLSRPLYVLEDEWRDNRARESCIPTGTYRCVPHGWEPSSPFKYKNTWQLLNVPNRTAILIHAGNTHKDTQGCLLVGMGMIVSQLSSAVTDSRMALDFLRQEIGQQAFLLTIE